ncbi:MAG TPA: hypothetical protein VFF81_06430 [Noviherbaspirillum sp.]|nr:hypothetical protein [Noviherbaspirillum sp.]
MNDDDDDDDYDPDVESILEYAARKVRHRQDRQQESTTPLAARTGSRTGYEIQAALQELIEAQKHAVTVDDFIFALRSLASRLEQEADRLQARGTINFHVCYSLQ